jgi:lipopolysaccharide/colanic/teichoic acid biosynthesis glycosyltransferase
MTKEEYATMSSVSETSRRTSGPTTAAGYPPWKAATEWVLACVLLVLTAPLILAVMVLVRLTSRGPGIYRQTRLGLEGRRYRIYKIRTMRHDCERLTGPQWSTPGDARITPIGRILRVTHIDELPQLWNVLRGEMSLVGPRPERPEIAVGLEQVLPRYRDRLLVRPGVTGLAQVQLPPDTDIESVRRKLACDLYYIRHVSLWLDLRIMMGTVLGILGTPWVVTRQLLRIPDVDIAETAYRDLSNKMDILPEGIEPISRVTRERLRIPGADVAETANRHDEDEVDTLNQGVEPMAQVRSV